MPRLTGLAAFAIACVLWRPADADYVYKTFSGPMNSPLTFLAADDHGGRLARHIDASSNLVFTYETRTSSVVLSYPGAAATYCWDIDNAGTVVGSYLDTSGVSHGFTYAGGTYRAFVPPAELSAVNVVLTAISRRTGEIGGSYDKGGNRTRPFVIRNGKVHRLDFPELHSAAVEGVSDTGDVTVQTYATRSTGIASYLVQGSHITTLSFPGAMFTRVH